MPDIEGMRIVLAGGTGFLGQALTDALARDGHHLVVLSRRERAHTSAVRTVSWTPDGNAGAWLEALDNTDAVINLAGESIADGRWTADRKRRILDSRVQATRSLALAISRVARPPAVLISSSGVGYYGACADDLITETHPAGGDFLASVCVRWEQEALRAVGPGTRVVCVRTGLVLDRHGGALPKMLLPFRAGVGGRLGSGRQYMPWIHLQDWVDLVRFLLTARGATGAVNAAAPNPVTNAEFTRVLARVLHRPALLPAPAFALRLALGEMADALLLSGQRAVPAAAEHLGYRFTHRDVEAALTQILA